jgi:CBS domain-containing protein
VQSRPVAIDPDADIEEAIDLLLEHRISALPVVELDTGLLRGIVSYEDVLRAARSIVARAEEALTMQ